jgi:hypothetical protein
MTPLLPILLVISSRLRRQGPQFALSRASRDLRLILRGEERLSRGCSSIARADAVRLILMPWNWIFPPTLHIHLAWSPKTA